MAITHITPSDLMMYGGTSLLYSHGLTFLGAATVLGALAAGAFIFLGRKK